MLFSIIPLEFDYIARGPVVLDEGKATNVLRGALGLELRRFHCPADCSDSRSCPYPEPCLYQQLFEGETRASRPSGYREPPRPFVLRSADWEARTVAPGQHLVFALNFFDQRPELVDALLLAASNFERLGPGRAPVELQEVRQPGRVGLDLAPVEGAPRRVRVRFVTPTEIKVRGEITRDATFEPLFARLHERIRFLLKHYSNCEPMAKDGTLDAAKKIVTTRQDLRQFSTTRYSTRTEQTHPLAGFVGEAEYEGDFTLLWPWMKASEWAGVGRQTVWGKGALAWASLD